MKSPSSLLIIAACFGVGFTHADLIAREGDQHREPEARFSFFAFFNDAGLNLHDYLYWRAREEAPRDEGRACLDSQPPEVRQGWDGAEAHYRVAMAERNHRTDPLMRSVRRHFTGGDIASPEELQALLPIIESAKPAFEACFWTDHRERNSQWINSALDLLEIYGEPMEARIAQAYATSWPDLVAVDVVSYASWAGANSIVEPHHVMITAVRPEYSGLSAIEMLYHEASHTIMGPRYGAVAEEINKVAAKLGMEPPRNLWHAVLFHTAGHTMASLVAKRQSSYEPYMFRHGVFEGAHDVLRLHWASYLEGKVERDQAVADMVAALLDTRSVD